MSEFNDLHCRPSGIHFVYEENIIKSHPDINTNIIFWEHSDKLINFNVFEFNYTRSIEEDDDYFFIATKIYSDEKVIIVEGTVGYSYDPKDIKLIYDLVENKIYVGSYYRFLQSETDFKLFVDKYKMTNGLVVLNKTNLVYKSSDESQTITLTPLIFV